MDNFNYTNDLLFIDILMKIKICNIIYQKYIYIVKDFRILKYKNLVYKNLFKFNQNYELPVLFLRNIKKRRYIKQDFYDKKKLYFKKKYKVSVNSEGFLNVYKKKNDLNTLINKKYLKIKNVFLKNKISKAKLKRNIFKKRLLIPQKNISKISIRYSATHEKNKIKMQELNNKIQNVNNKIQKLNNKIQNLNENNQVVTKKFFNNKHKKYKYLNNYLKRQKNYLKRQNNFLKRQKKFFNKEHKLKTLRYLFKKKLILKYFIVKKYFNIIEFLKLYRELKKYKLNNLCF